MALNKEKINATGVVTNYHRIATIINDANTGRTIIAVASYQDEQARKLEQRNWKDLAEREANGLPITPSTASSVTDIVIDYNEGLTRADAYEKLKATDEFSGAVEV